MQTTPPEAITPEKLPDPWLLDSAELLAELDRIRGLVTHIPITIQNHAAQNTVIDAIWRLQEDLRYVLRLHRDGQNAFARRAVEPEPLDMADTGVFRARAHARKLAPCRLEIKRGHRLLRNGSAPRKSREAFPA